MDNGNKKRGRPPKTKDYNSPLAKRLRELCKGRTQQEIADGAGITRQNLGKFLSGETKPDVDTLEKLATFFNVSSDYLLGLSNNKTTDANLQAACEYTGLNEEAVESLHGYLVYTPTEYRKEDFNSFEQYEEYNKIMLKHISLMAKIANDYIASDYFYYFLESIMDIEQDSAEWVEICKTNIKQNGQEFYGNDETKKLADKCDIAILECNRWIDAFIQRHDHRHNKQKLIALRDYYALKDINKQVLAEIEEEDNGEHNPPKE